MIAAADSPRAYLAWSGLERIIQVLITAVVGALVARHLGPPGFGLLNTVWSLAALCWPIALIGHQLAVQEMVLDADDDGRVLAVAFFVNAVGAGVGILVFFAATIVVPKDDGTAFTAVALLFGSTLAVQPLLLADVWFQARRVARLPALMRSAGLLLGAALRVAVVAAGLGVVAVAATMSLDVLAPAVLVFVALRWRRRKSLPLAQVTMKECRTFAKQALPLVVAGISVAIYMRIDQVMVQVLSGNRAAGLYAAAVRLSEGSYFLALVILRAATPSLVRLRALDEEEYEEGLTVLFARMIMLSTAIALLSTVFAPVVTRVLFGSAFEGVAAVLRVHAWSSIFVFLGVGQSIWFVTENEERTIMRRTIFGAVLNVGLNIFLIPAYGPPGAAVATLVAYSTVTVIANGLVPRTRPVLRMQIAASSPRFQLGVLKRDLATMIRS